jgi:hypothetical protein
VWKRDIFTQCTLQEGFHTGGYEVEQGGYPLSAWLWAVFLKIVKMLRKCIFGVSKSKSFFSFLEETLIGRLF